MIDPEGAIFGKPGSDNVVDLPARFKIGAKRLFQREAGLLSCKSGTPDPSNIWPALYVASWTRSPDLRSIVLHRSVRAAKLAAPARDLGKQPSLRRRPAPP